MPCPISAGRLPGLGNPKAPFVADVAPLCIGWAGPAPPPPGIAPYLWRARSRAGESGAACLRDSFLPSLVFSSRGLAGAGGAGGLIWKRQGSAGAGTAQAAAPTCQPHSSRLLLTMPLQGGSQRVPPFRWGVARGAFWAGAAPAASWPSFARLTVG